MPKSCNKWNAECRLLDIVGRLFITLNDQQYIARVFQLFFKTFMAFQKDPRLQCTVCFSYLDSMQKVCCINSCLPFPDRIFNPNAQRFPVYNGIRAQPVKFSLKTYDLTPVVSAEQSAPKRAVETLPEILRFDDTSRVWIPVRSLFGPLVAPSDPRRLSSLAKYAFKSGRNWKDFILDSDDECNWMKYVNSAENFEDQNVTAFHFDESVYFAVTKEIQIGDELKVWYADNYAAELGKPFLSWTTTADRSDVSAENLDSYDSEKLSESDELNIPTSEYASGEREDSTEDMEFDEPEVDDDPLFTQPNFRFSQPSVDPSMDISPEVDSIKEHVEELEIENDPVFAELNHSPLPLIRDTMNHCHVLSNSCDILDSETATFPNPNFLGKPESSAEPELPESDFLEGQSPLDLKLQPDSPEIPLLPRFLKRQVVEAPVAQVKVPDLKTRLGNERSCDWICGICALATRSLPEISEHSLLHSTQSKIRPLGEIPLRKHPAVLPEKVRGSELRGRKSNLKPVEPRVLRSSARLRKSQKLSYKEPDVDDGTGETQAPAELPASSADEENCDLNVKSVLTEKAGDSLEPSGGSKIETTEIANSGSKIQVNPLRCSQCGKDFKSRSRHKIHMEFKHGPVSKGFRRCVVCLQPVPRPDYPEHNAAHLDDDGKCPCPFCTKVLDSWKVATVHVRTYHYETVMTMEFKAIAAKVVGDPKLFSCQICSFVSAYQQSYKEHMRFHETSRGTCHRCDICDTPHTTYEKLRHHRITEHNLEDHVVGSVKVVKPRPEGPRRVKCVYCDFKNSRLKVVATHAVIHAVNGGFPCEICPRISVNYKAARSHVRCHQPKNLKCKICGFTDYSQARLDDHVRTHSDPEVECVECGKMFRTQAALRSHRVSQHGLKRLKRGIRMPTTKKKFIKKFESYFYKCMECSIGFDERNIFTEHLTSQHPEVSKLSFPELNLPMRNVEAFKCQCCPHVSITEEQSLEHQRKSHPETLVAANSEDEEEGELEFTDKSRPKLISYEAHWCEMCEAAFAKPRAFLKHVRTDHPDYHEVLMTPLNVA